MDTQGNYEKSICLRWLDAVTEFTERNGNFYELAYATLRACHELQKYVESNPLAASLESASDAFALLKKESSITSKNNNEFVEKVLIVDDFEFSGHRQPFFIARNAIMDICLKHKLIEKDDTYAIGEGISTRVRERRTQLGLG